MYMRIFASSVTQKIPFWVIVILLSYLIIFRNLFNIPELLGYFRDLPCISTGPMT